MSVSRYCSIEKVQDGSWYLVLGNEEYADRSDSTTYGPFRSESAANEYLDDNFSNPGGFWVDDSGRRPVPSRAVSPSRSSNWNVYPSPRRRR